MGGYIGDYEPARGTGFYQTTSVVSPSYLIQGFEEGGNISFYR